VEVVLDGFGDEGLGWGVVLAGGIEEGVELIQREGDFGDAEDLLSGPGGDFFGRGLPAGNRGVGEAVEGFSDFPQGEVVIETPFAELGAGHAPEVCYFVQ